MKTLTIQIGNTDNRLTQQEWADYVREISQFLQGTTSSVHFSGGSPAEAPWQNYCWVCGLEELIWHLEHHDEVLLTTLSGIGKKYNQDSVAVTIGETQFV